MAKNKNLVKRIQQDMLDKYDGVHSGVGIASLPVIQDLYNEGMYQLGRDSFPSDTKGLCVIVNLLEQPDKDFEYVTEKDGVHIFYRVTGMPKALT